MGFKEYARLGHLQTASQIMLIPLIGGLAVGSVKIIMITLLLFIGFLVHLFGFTLNEYRDVEIDMKSADLSEKPLVKGDIPRNYALIIAITSVTIAFLINIIFFQLSGASSMFILTIIFILVYNLYGKKFAGLDFLLGGGAFFFCMFGGLTVNCYLDPIIYIFASLFLLQWWFANIIEGGIKDAEHDYIAGVRSTTTFFGVKVNQRQLELPYGYKTLGWGLTVAYVITVVVAFAFFNLKFLYWQIVILLILCGSMLFACLKLLSMKEFQRIIVLKYIIIGEISKAFVPPIILVSLIGMNAILLAAFILLWSGFFMIFEYGTSPPAI